MIIAFDGASIKCLFNVSFEVGLHSKLIEKDDGESLVLTITRVLCSLLVASAAAPVDIYLNHPGRMNTPN